MTLIACGISVVIGVPPSRILGDSVLGPPVKTALRFDIPYIGWDGTWTKERYQSLKEKHPEPLIAFDALLRWEKESERLWQQALEKNSCPSPYIEEVEGWPESELRDHYLQGLKQLRDVMVHSKVGYISYAGGAILGRLKNRYPEAHEVFKKELEDL